VKQDAHQVAINARQLPYSLFLLSISPHFRSAESSSVFSVEEIFPLTSALVVAVLAWLIERFPSAHMLLCLVITHLVIIQRSIVLYGSLAWSPSPSSSRGSVSSPSLHALPPGRLSLLYSY
jgi:hypothetical protein